MRNYYIWKNGGTATCFFFYREVRKSGSPFLGTVGVLDVFSRMSLAQPLQALGSIFSFVKRMFFYAFVWRSFVFV